MNTSYLQLFENGFLPGPSESREQFFNRIEETKKVLKDPEKFIPKEFIQSGLLSPLNGASLLLSNTKGFLQASCTTILEINKLLPIAIITKPSKFSSYFVSSKEVLNHEKIHALRAMFEKSKYEEFIAYRTSKSFFRRYFSPIIGSTFDRIIFYTAAILTPLFYPLSLLIFSFALSRLIYRQRKVSKTLINLSSSYSNPERILIGLTDCEIDTSFDPSTNSSFRWEFLNEIFKNK